MSFLSLRPAVSDDLMMVLEWANDPQTRAMSFHQNTIQLAEHRLWFEAVLQNPKAPLLIVEINEEEKERKTPVGQVRFSPDGEISLAIAPAFRGQGLGVPILNVALEFATQHLDFYLITAHIRFENQASQKIFERAGFVFHQKNVVRGVECLQYLFELK